MPYFAGPEFTAKSVERVPLRVGLVYRFRMILKNADNALDHGLPVTICIPDGNGKPGAVASGC